MENTLEINKQRYDHKHSLHDHTHEHQCHEDDIKKDKQKDIGAADKYMPLCRRCYLQFNDR